MNPRLQIGSLCTVILLLFMNILILKQQILESGPEAFLGWHVPSGSTGPLGASLSECCQRSKWSLHGTEGELQPGAPTPP